MAGAYWGSGGTNCFHCKPEGVGIGEKRTTSNLEDEPMASACFNCINGNCNIHGTAKKQPSEAAIEASRDWCNQHNIITGLGIHRDLARLLDEFAREARLSELRRVRELLWPKSIPAEEKEKTK